MRRLELFLTLGIILLAFNAHAQRKIISGQIKDFHSDEPVPFASVYFKGTTTGMLSDSAGGFLFSLSHWPSDTIEITCVGYQPYELYIDPSKDSLTVMISMERGTFTEGVKVKVRVNKGLLVWRKVVKNKPRNDRYRFDNFSYELYNKLEIDLKNLNFKGLSKLRPLKPVTNLINSNIDSTEMPPVLPTYLTEALSDYYYQKKPQRRREVIRAASTNGVDNESIIKFLGGMDQNIDVYDNFIPIFDKLFVSPASDNGDAYYDYRVTDTQFVNHRKFYHLVFAPKHRGENCFEGDCWVNDTTFAVQKMNLRLGKDANVNFLERLSLIQEYKLINDTTWFLSRDKFVADLAPFGKESFAFVGRKTTTYQNVVINDTSVTKEVAKNRLQEEVITLKGASTKDREYWNASRPDTLSKSEKAIVKMIDTLMNAPVFKRFTNTINFIGTGYLNVGNFQLGPWYNAYTYNLWERSRVRFDLGTNYKFNRKIWLHGYLAYGFGDKKYKGQAEIFYLPQKNPRMYFDAYYINDLDFGQNYYGEVTSDNIFALAIRKNNIPIKYMNIDEKHFEFFRETHSGFSVSTSAINKSYTPLQNLPPKDSFVVKGPGNPLTTFQVGIKLRFAYLEKFLETNFFRSSLGSPYPITEVTFSHGISGVLKSSYNYNKVSASVYDYFKVPPYGSLYFNVFGGRTFGTLPYVFLDIQPGNELYYYDKYAFNMMNKYEFITDRYLGINLEHNFGNGIFRLIPKLKFRQFWTAKVLWGSLSKENQALNFLPGSNFQSLNGRTYMELGTGIDNILHLLRIDFIWRVFPATLDKKGDHPFGVFGSFNLSF
ncbi:MAG TPA: DUF5686 family protein [Chitinophagaceae bacterium]